jgi:hypothetical protein
VAAGNADFRLIDPPRVSPQPVSPNRVMLMSMVFAAALAAGLFLPFAASQLRPVFHRVNDLRDKIGLPILGVVSLTLGEAEVRREARGRLHFWAASSALVCCFGIGIATMAILANR